MKPASYFETYRKQMPVVERYTYLNSAGCGPYPQSVWDSMRGVFEYIFDEGQINVQVHDRLFEMLEEARRDVVRFIHAAPEEIFFVRCIAEGFNTIDYMLDLGPGDKVLVSNQENPASLLPFFAAEKIRGFTTRKFKAEGGYDQICQQFEQALDTGAVKLAAFSHVLHAIGTKMPAKDLCRIAREHGVLTALDGAQAAGNAEIDVKDMGCDFYVISCHKWMCGPEGIAAVYVRRELIPQLRVPFGGVGMQESFDMATNEIALRNTARRFEYGGKHIPMYTAFSHTIRLAEEIGTENIYARQRELNRFCREQFSRRLPQARILSPEDERLMTGIFAFTIPGVDHRALVKAAWEQEKIIIQYRTIDLYTKEEGIRVSNNWFVREDEILKLLDFLERYMEEHHA